MSPSKQKGTAWETEVVRRLQSFGFKDAHRSEANRQSWDIVGVKSGKDFPVEWVIECKKTKRWRVFDWIPAARKANPNPHEGVFWVIFASHGDQRSEQGRSVGDVAILDAEVFMDLLAANQEAMEQQ